MQTNSHCALPIVLIFLYLTCTFNNVYIFTTDNISGNHQNKEMLSFKTLSRLLILIKGKRHGLNKLA